MMKIKVKPEGRPGIYLPDRNSLAIFLEASDETHVHKYSTLADGIGLMGTDCPIGLLVEDVHWAVKVAILMGGARENNFGHSLALVAPAEDGRPARLEMYDVELEDDDLEVEP